MIIKDRGDFLRLDVTERVPVGVQGAGDTRFEIEVQMSAGLDTVFHGKSWAYLEASAIRQFAGELHELLEGRAESASVISMSPNEFDLTIRTYNKARHIGVFGKLGHWCESEADESRWSEINYGFRIEHIELQQLMREFGDLCGKTA